MKRTKKIQRHQRAMEAVAQVSKQVIMQVSKLNTTERGNSQVLDRLRLGFKLRVDMIYLLSSRASLYLKKFQGIDQGFTLNNQIR